MAKPQVTAVPRGIITTALSTPSANTAAVVTLAAVAGRKHVVRLILWSYNSAPTGGRLTITDGGATKIDFDITAAGPGPLPLEQAFDVNSEVVVTLAAAGASVTGKLTVQYYSFRGNNA